MKDRYIAVVLLLLLLLLAVVGVALLSKNIRDTRKAQLEEQKIADACGKLNECDVTIYWIGEYPDSLKGIMPKVRICDEVNTDTMPMKSPEFHSIRYDKDGNKLEEWIPVDYTDFLYIVINKKVLSDDEYSVIRECIVDNDVKAVIMGRDAIEAWRGFLILPKADYTENDTMEYSMNKGYDSHVFGDGTDFGEGTREIDLIEYLLGDMKKYGDRFIENNTDNSEG